MTYSPSKQNYKITAVIKEVRLSNVYDKTKPIKDSLVIKLHTHRGVSINNNCVYFNQLLQQIRQNLQNVERTELICKQGNFQSNSNEVPLVCFYC